jgi:hypothetical protein
MSHTNGQPRRFRGSYRCPICNGAEDDARGEGTRCYGFLSGDGQYAHCTREDHAGPLQPDPNGQTYPHKIGGEFRCGREHAPATEPARPARSARTIDRAYDYRDEDYRLIFQAIRFRNPKGFAQRRPDPDKPGEWIWNLRGIDPIPYRLAELAAADPAEPVFIVEGEKDVENLAAAGILATCNPMGAGKWRDTYSAHLAARHCIIIPDNDAPGEAHALEVARSIDAHGASVRILRLEGIPEKGDVSDWLARGHTAAELRQLADAAPLWTPAEASRNGTPPTRPAPSSNGTPPTIPSPWANGKHDHRANGKAKPNTFANFDQAQEEDKVVRLALRMEALSDRLDDLTPGWPKRVGIDETLFLESADQEPVYLDSSTRLFAWIDGKAQVDWTKGARFIPQERFYEHLRMTAPHFDAIETLPHWPAIPGIHYMHRPVVGRSTGGLEQLLNFFCPYHATDRQLIKAFIVSLFWGGDPGTRPAFLITGPDQDPNQGRGVGKSRRLNVIGEIVGETFDVLPTEQIGDVKTRLLSDAGRHARLARLDNVKSLKFSWADLENLITAPAISGKMLYRGEGRRPNTIIWGITLNGASLSKDMAQRVIPIKLRRPDCYSATWEADVTAFVRAHRWDIMADARVILEAPRPPLDVRTRWATWEADVLSRVETPNLCQNTILERQATVDDDNEERDLVGEYFREQLSKREHNPESQAIFIRVRDAARWLNEATNQKLPTNKASTQLSGLGIAELRKAKSEGVRGYRWQGPSSEPGADAVKLRPEPRPVF